MEDASKEYFNKHPKDLNIYEILMLQAIIPRPSHYNPYNESDLLLKRVNLLIEKLKNTYPKKYRAIRQQNKLPALSDT